MTIPLPYSTIASLRDHLVAVFAITKADIALAIPDTTPVLKAVPDESNPLDRMLSIPDEIWDQLATRLAATLEPSFLNIVTRAGANVLDKTITDLSRVLRGQGKFTRVLLGLARMRELVRGSIRNLPPTEPGRLGLSIRMDLINPYAVTFARNHALELARHLTDQARTVARQVVVQAIEGELDWKTTATTLRGVIGLHPRYARAVIRYRDKMREDGLDPRHIDRQTSAYARRLVKSRAETISRTELMRASNMGRVAAWRVAEQAGFIDRTEGKQWLIGPKLDRKGARELGHSITGPCSLCAPMEDVTIIPYDGEFQLPNGRHVISPPAHPGCRCVCVLVPQDVPVLSWEDQMERVES